MANSYTYGEDTGYVDIHGRDIRVLVCQKTGRILVPIDELKEMGFSIYLKSQYRRYLVEESQFNREFNLFMLQCAQNYMLRNKIVFKENEILESINNCKKLLTEGLAEAKNEHSPTPAYCQNNVIQAQEENIAVRGTLREPQPMTVQNLNAFNDHKFKGDAKRSPASSVHSSEGNRRSRNFNNNANGRMNSFDQRNRNSNLSYGKGNFFEQRRGGFKPFEKNYSEESVNKSSYLSPELKLVSQGYRNGVRDDTKKVASIELTEAKHKVLITFKEKPNVVWVQDVNNVNTLFEINKKTQEELKNERVVNRCEFNNVYLAQFEDIWCRCKPIKFKPLTIFFIDYGNTAQVVESDLREVSKDLAEIPSQCVKLIIEDENCTVEENSYITVKILGRTEGGTYKVEILKTADEPEVRPSQETKPKIPVYFNKPQPFCTLQNNERILVIKETNSKLVVRTKECHDKLMQIEKEIEDAPVVPIGDTVEKMQLVLCNKDGKLKRGHILDVKGASAEVELFDLFEMVTVDVSSLKNITESLSSEPLTYVLTPVIRGFKNTKMHPKAKEYLQDLVQKRAKGNVILENGEFDLKMGEVLLSDKLKSFDPAFNRTDKPKSADPTLNRTMLKDLNKYEPPLGIDTYMLYDVRDRGVTLVSEEGLTKYLSEIIIDVTFLKDPEPYIPIKGEICLGLYQESWSRCLIIRVLSSNFEVQFIDFGNFAFLKSEELRKLPEDVKKAPILGVPCKFVGLPSVSKCDEWLKDNISDEIPYQVNVIKNVGDYFEIEVPTLYAKMG